MRPGIERINITDKVTGRGAWRFERSKKARPHANQIYRSIFDLNPGDIVVDCKGEEALARYDRDLGIDILLRFTSGMTATVQEKILTWHEATATVEDKQNPQTGEEGDWYKLKCDYYFVGYARDDPAIIEEWILLDWNQVKLHVNQIPWYENNNKNDGAQASFKYAFFTEIPDKCIVASHYDIEKCKRDAKYHNPIRLIKQAACPAPEPKPEPRRRIPDWTTAAKFAQTRFDDLILPDAWNETPKGYNGE